MQTINRQDLKNWKDTGKDFVLINVLPEDHFRKQHIPGSVNIPVGEDNFEEKVERQAGGKDRPIVVYCANTECSASPTAAKKLDQAGLKTFTITRPEWKIGRKPI